MVREDVFGLAPPPNTDLSLLHSQDPAANDAATKAIRDKLTSGARRYARDARGRFAAAAGIAAGKLKALGAKAAHAEHAASSYVKDKIAAGVSKLPPKAQKVVHGAFAVGVVGKEAAFATWTFGQALAERVAVAKGYSPEQARRLRGVLMSLDIATFKPASIGLHATGLSLATVGLATFIPPATASYLMYSTAKNPMATLRGAKDLVVRGARMARLGYRRLRRRLLGNEILDQIFLVRNGPDQTSSELVLALERHNFDDWYIALLSAATDELADVPAALRLAEDLYSSNPTAPPSAEEQLTDAEAAAVLGLTEDEYEELALSLDGKALALNVAPELTPSAAHTLLQEWCGRSPTANTQHWKLLTSEDKLKSFVAWLRTKFHGALLTEDQLWARYIAEGFKQGTVRAFKDGKPKGSTENDEQLLASALNHPVSVERVKVLASRTLSDIEGITEATATAATRTLADGLIRGLHPKEIAKNLVNDVEGIGTRRALALAHTEIIRAHAEGQLTAMERMGVDKVGVMVEWNTAGTGVCQLCLALKGITIPVSQAHGMIPRHVRCRCAWTPAGLGEDTSGQKSGKKAAAAITKSTTLGGKKDQGAQSLNAATIPDPVVDALSPILVALDPIGNAAKKGKGGGYGPDWEGIFSAFGDKPPSAGKTRGGANCGIGKSGFLPGNKCATGDGSTSTGDKSLPPSMAALQENPSAFGFKPVEQSEFDAMKRRRSKLEAAGKLGEPEDQPTKLIAISKLLSTPEQEDLMPKRVKEYVDRKPGGNPSHLSGDTIQVVKFNGKYIIEDGNHRAIAEHLKGNGRIKAIVYDLDEPTSNAAKKAGPGCGTGAGGFKPGNTCAKGGAAPTALPTGGKVPQQPMTEKALRAKAAHVMVDRDIQRYSEEHNEPVLAKKLGGKSDPDNRPYDVKIAAGKIGRTAHGVELKTVVVGENNKITMKGEAQDRKARWEVESGAVFHTVIFDDRQVKDALGPGKHDDSKRVILYKRGGGSFRTGNMHAARSYAELQRLMAMSDNELPQAARSTIQWQERQAAARKLYKKSPAANEDLADNALFGLFGGTKAKGDGAGGGNCGTGSGGFKPGNTCAKGGDTPDQPSSAPGGRLAPSTGMTDPNVPELTQPSDQRGNPTTLSRKFKAWFGDWQGDPEHSSKVTNADGSPAETAHASLVSKVARGGQPVVVFHGTPRGPFDEFRFDKIAKPDDLYFGPGFYFTEDIGAAKIFAETQHASGKAESPAVMHLYLNIRKPFDADNDKIDPRDVAEEHRKQLRAAIVQKAFSDEGRSEALAAGRRFDEGEMRFSYKELADTWGVSKTVLKDALVARGYDGITVQSPDVSHAGTNRFWVAFMPTQIKSTNARDFDPDDPIITHAADDQPRHPKGDPRGGQFARSGGSAPPGAGGGTTAQPPAPPTAPTPAGTDFASRFASKGSRQYLEARAKADVALARVEELRAKVNAPGRLYEDYKDDLALLGEAQKEYARLDEAAELEARSDLRASMMARGDRGKVPFGELMGTAWTSEEKGKRYEAHIFVEDLTHKDHVIPEVLYGRPEDGRAYYSPHATTPSIHVIRKDDVGTYVHELGHHLEHNIPGARDKAFAFLEKRTGGQQTEDLRKRFGSRFDEGEEGHPDDWGKLFPDDPPSAHYVGKRYFGKTTEIISMGLELMYRRPKHFARTDPEYFNLMVDILRPGRVTE